MPRPTLVALAAFGLLAGLSSGSFVHAEEITTERVQILPDADQAPWRAYLARSAELARADQAALDAELKLLDLTEARKAPDGGDFKLSENTAADWFASAEAGALADVILSYQTPSGGWSKHTGYARGPRQPGMLWSSQYEPGRSPHYLATFDNGSTTRQIQFLAAMALATGREDCRAGVLRGVDFILAAQYPHGGWPQVYPLEGAYHDDVTFNDSAMTNVLAVLRDIHEGAPEYAFVDADRRARVSAALTAGIACIIATQQETGGVKSVWCAQYDPLTLRPASARKMEPASLSGLESARVLEFLITLRDQTPEVIAAANAGLAWMEQARVTDVAKRKVNGKTIYQIDPASTEIYWARFYDLQSGKPIFPGRDGVVYENYEAMIAKNAGGYDYFSTIPGSVVGTKQKKWRKQLAAAQAGAR